MGIFSGLCFLSVGYGEYAALEAINTEPGLWASPIHLLAAGVLPAGLLVLALMSSPGPKPTSRLVANLSLQAAILGGLGLI